jgi:hypothetical protein
MGMVTRVGTGLHYAFKQMSDMTSEETALIGSPGLVHARKNSAALPSVLVQSTFKLTANNQAIL